jgi:hypothetical protein
LFLALQRYTILTTVLIFIKKTKYKLFSFENVFLFPSRSDSVSRFQKFRILPPASISDHDEEIKPTILSKQVVIDDFSVPITAPIPLPPAREPTINDAITTDGESEQPAVSSAQGSSVLASSLASLILALLA